MLCPHCQAPLVIRQYREEWADFTLDASSSLLGPEASPILESTPYEGAPTDHECAECKENIDDLIGEPLAELMKKFPQSFPSAPAPSACSFDHDHDANPSACLIHD